MHHCGVTINFSAQCGTSEETLKEQFKASIGRKSIQPSPYHGRKLAVVGGGPSVLEHLDELKEWNGDIWAINYTGTFLLNHGIKSTFVTIDGGWFDTSKLTGIESALVTSCCDPELYDAFPDVTVFDAIEISETGIIGGTTTATRMPHLSAMLGYGDVSFFGCEGSYIGQDHIDRHVGNDPLIVRVDGIDYVTNPEFLMQAQNLAEIFRNYPQIYKDRSGGLVSALTKCLGFSVVAVSESLKRSLEDQGNPAIFITPYQGNANALL